MFQFDRKTSVPFITDEEQRAVLRTYGFDQSDLDVLEDLTKHAAEKALDTIITVARSAPDPIMINLITAGACAKLGRGVATLMLELMEERRKQQPKGKRDFDGNFS